MRTRSKGLYRKVVQRTATFAAAVVLAGVAVPFAIGGAHADTVTDEARYVELINQSRVSEGLKPLQVHPALVVAARRWAGEMEKNWDPATNDICQISHNPNLRTAVDANWQKLGENVGCGDVDVDTLEQKFMESPRHRANIMDPTFDTVGIGIVMKGDVMFVTQQFMQQRSTPAPADASGAPNALALASPTSTIKSAPVATVPKKPVTKAKPRTSTTKTTKKKVPVKKK